MRNFLKKASTCVQAPAAPVPGGPFMRVKPPSPYSVAEAVIACCWLWFIFDLINILNPTGSAFLPKARGSNFVSCFSGLVLPFWPQPFPSSIYCMRGMLSDSLKAIYSRSAFGWRTVRVEWTKVWEWRKSCNAPNMTPAPFLMGYISVIVCLKAHRWLTSHIRANTNDKQFVQRWKLPPPILWRTR